MPADVGEAIAVYLRSGRPSTAAVRAVLLSIPPKRFERSLVTFLTEGRKQRITPLSTGTVAVLRAWLAERGAASTEPLFPTRAGRALSRDADGNRLTFFDDDDPEEHAYTYDDRGNELTDVWSDFEGVHTTTSTYDCWQ